MIRLLIWVKQPGALAIAFASFVIVARMLFPLPDLAGRNDTYALAPSTETRLGAQVLAGSEKNPGKSGVFPLSNGAEAYGARIYWQGQHRNPSMFTTIFGKET